MWKLTNELQVFTVGASDKHLYHIWQLERDSSWSDWDDIGMLSPSSGFASLPYIMLDVHGWWQAFAVSVCLSVCASVAHHSEWFRVHVLEHWKSIGQVIYAKILYVVS